MSAESAQPSTCLPCEPWNNLVKLDGKEFTVPYAMAVAVRHKNVVRLHQWVEVCDDRYRPWLLDTIFELSSYPHPALPSAVTPAKDAPKHQPSEPWCAIVTHKDGDVPLAVLDAFLAKDANLLLEYGKVCDRRYLGWISLRLQELGAATRAAATAAATPAATTTKPLARGDYRWERD